MPTVLTLVYTIACKHTRRNTNTHTHTQTHTHTHPLMLFHLYLHTESWLDPADASWTTSRVLAPKPWYQRHQHYSSSTHTRTHARMHTHMHTHTHTHPASLHGHSRLEAALCSPQRGCTTWLVGGISLVMELNPQAFPRQTPPVTFPVVNKLTDTQTTAIFNCHWFSQKFKETGPVWVADCSSFSLSLTHLLGYWGGICGTCWAFSFSIDLGYLIRVCLNWQNMCPPVFSRQ